MKTYFNLCRHRIDIPMIVASGAAIVLFMAALTVLIYHVATAESAGIAIKKGDPALLRRCLEKNPSEAVYGERGGLPYLLWCSARGFDEGIESLLEYGARIDTIDPHKASKTYGWSALHFAALNGNRSTIQLLLRHGADLDLPDPKGVTPRMVMAKRGMLAELFPREPDVKRKGPSAKIAGTTP